METRIVDTSSRPWARGKQYQNFIGKYLRYPSGLWLDQDVDKQSAELIENAFAALPEQLIALALRYQLTVNISWMEWTPSGNSAAIYADWTNHDEKFVSPHVQFGLRSLRSELLKPHFTHELCHLWWKRHVSPPQKAKYTALMQATTRRGANEVTEYVQESYFLPFLEYCETADATRTTKDRAHIIESMLERWVEESFCETVAAIRFPGYPFERWKRTVNLEKRHKAIKSITKLLPVSASAAAK